MSTWARHLYEHDPLAIAKGEVNDYSVRNIFGYNSSVSTTFIPAWENSTVYTYPTQALTMTITSNVADNGVVVLIAGLDTNYNQISETVTLAGSATTVNQYFRINDVITVSGNALNDITISNGGITYSKVRGGDGKNQASIYTVPAGYSFYLTRIDGFSATTTGSSKYLLFRNYVRLNSGVVLRVAETTFLNQMQILRQAPFKYIEKTDIALQAKSSSGVNEVGLFAEGYLIKNIIQGEP
tara:strand:+ start:750 stop:1469 length:720 start_codon:yes stop_codon:yes gene_type:complete